MGPWAYWLSMKKCRFVRRVQDMFSGVRFSRHRRCEPLPVVVYALSLIHIYIAGTAVPVDLVAANGGVSAAICSVGLDSEVAYSIPKYRRLPLCGGQMAYNISIVERLLQPMGHRLRITVDDDVLEGDYLIATVCNGVAYGGGSVSYTHLDVYKRQCFPF